jgi:hypothetical protein
MRVKVISNCVNDKLCHWIVVDIVLEPKYSRYPLVKQCVSISVIVALVYAFVPLHGGMSCRQAQTAMVCHRTPGMTHHCEGMDDAQFPTDDNEAGRISGIHSPSKCPMNCCFRFGSDNKGAVVIEAAYFVPTSTGHSSHPTSDIFTNNGFSSHTDRGPPFLS